MLVLLDIIHWHIQGSNPPETKPVPYRSVLQEKIEPGQTLIVKGSTIDESQRFTINLHSKSADFSGNDVPLHISVRFDEGKIVMNTFSNGEWGKEERKSNPIKKGDSFDIRIRAHDDRFQIIIDQKEFKDYEHRLPLTSITHLSIDGDLYLNHVHWGGKYYMNSYVQSLSKRWVDYPCGFIASRLQNRGGAYSTLSVGACSLGIPRPGPAAILLPRNPSFRGGLYILYKAAPLGDCVYDFFRRGALDLLAF
ncbi:hypothetical protein Y032_0063g3411 [Ancylostoma ceylanicum]|uniref:Galectin n=1 Tax=Ancylostoma ceylanicum TaxID=53326 RepID=A0A016U194_9BILA|nr:hypothetical protein Y032_0063g3411 [Ancylostoma ceylanicum]